MNVLELNLFLGMALCNYHQKKYFSSANIVNQARQKNVSPSTLSVVEKVSRGAYQSCHMTHPRTMQHTTT